MVGQVEVVECIVQLPFGCHFGSTDMYCSSCNTLVFYVSSVVSRPAPRSSIVCIFGQNNHTHHDILVISSL